MSEHFDVVVVGAGISGIGAGYFLQRDCPGRSYVILEGRSRTGGTWDLFRYPGIRSDSDMYTLGYSFKPWTNAKAIADGLSILNYLDETAREYGIDRHIRKNHRVVSANWSTEDARWTVQVERGDAGEQVEFTCNFLFMCAGYYKYEAGYQPDFPGVEDFAGTLIHPQKWPEGFNYAGKRVVVIGSGATAVTLVPSMAQSAGHVTMLQRSPSYVFSRPSVDPIANRLRKWLPAKLAYRVTRFKNVSMQQIFYKLARMRPEKAKARLVGLIRDELGAGYDVDKHFTPSYNPWDQRVCLVPDSDLFHSIKSGKASVVTDHIDRFEANGIRLKSGNFLPADVIITATGLDLQLMGGVQFSLDGARVDPAKSIGYKAMMYSDIPNLASSFGYTNASWTLKSDLTCAYVCRLLNTMEKRGLRQVTPRVGTEVQKQDFLDFTSGYVQRAMDRFPKQGDRRPWKVHQNYGLDLLDLKFGGIDEEMEFSNPVPAPGKAQITTQAKVPA